MSDVRIGKFKKHVSLGDESAVQGEQFTLQVSGNFTLIGDRYVPDWVEIAIHSSPNEPIQSARVELRDDVPQVVKLHFDSTALAQREIRQADLRATEISALCVDLVAGLSVHVDLSDPKAIVVASSLQPDRWPDALRLLERQRRNPGLRDITPELLAEVAKVYRGNIDRAPTQAVAKTFGVRSRMASTYVQKARERGLLPPTKQGKKQA